MPVACRPQRPAVAWRSLWRAAGVLETLCSSALLFGVGTASLGGVLADSQQVHRVVQADRGERQQTVTAHLQTLQASVELCSRAHGFADAEPALSGRSFP